jgi:hypothetical protein
MQTSWDVVFNKSRHFYLCPTTYASPAFLIDPLSFLHFPNAPPASLFIPRSTLPSSMSSSESPPVVLNYTVKPPVTQFYSHHGARLSDAPASSDAISSDVSSSSFIEDVPSSPHVEPSSSTDSSPKQLVRPSHRLHRLPGCYSPSTFTATALSESASYREAILHLEWQHAMAKEIAALERTGTWDHVPCPPSPPPRSHVFVRSLVSGSIRLRLALMVLLSAIRLVLLLVVFSRSKVMIMMRLLLLLLI